MYNLFFLIIIIPVGWFTYKFYVDFYMYERKVSTFNQVIPFCLLVIYLAFLIINGAEESIHYFKDISGRRRAIYGIWTFVMPSISFSCIIFPYQVSEVTKLYKELTSVNMNYVFRPIGYIALFITFFRNWLVVT